MDKNLNASPRKYWGENSCLLDNSEKAHRKTAYLLCFSVFVIFYSKYYPRFFASFQRRAMHWHRVRFCAPLQGISCAMDEKKKGVGRFPHVKGLQKKRTKNGHRWILTDTDFTGKSRSITVKILDTDPIDVFFRKVNDARQALKRKCACKSFEDYLNAFCAMRQLSSKTVQAYKIALRGFSFDDRKNARLINDFLRSDRKASTQKVTIAKINSFFRWLIQRGEPVKNPVADIVIKARTPHRSRILTEGDLAIFLQYAREREPEYRLFCLLLLHTGARVSTIGALTAQSLDKNNRLHLFNVKCKKQYDVEFPLCDNETLELWKEKTACGVLWECRWEKYARRLTHWMRRKFGEDANGERLSAHSIRHTFASRALQNGVPLEIVSKLLDHSSISTTLSVYAKFSQEQIDKAVEIATKN